MSSEASSEANIDVSAVILALDAEARAGVQGAMEKIASTGDTSSPRGLVDMLKAAVAVLLGAKSSITHAAIENAAPSAPSEAEARFKALAERAHGRIDHEIIRNQQGELSRSEAPPMEASEAPGVVIVTLIVAARRELQDLPTPSDRAALTGLLRSFAEVDPETFVALDVIWSPAAAEERIGIEEAITKYSELKALG